MAEESRPARDVDWRLLGPLLAHVVFTHVVVGVVRVTISYRTLELGLPVVWLGVISAGFAILPIFTAVQLGRYIDRGHDAHAAWIGSALILAACVALWAWPGSAILLLVFTILLGTGHMFLMAAQQMMTVRCATARGRETAFGHFMVAVSIGQGLGPLIVGGVGGNVTVPATGPLFTVGLITGALCMAIALALRPAPQQQRPPAGPAVPLLELLRRPGMMVVLISSVVTVTAGDLLVIYLPMLGAIVEVAPPEARGTAMTMRITGNRLGLVFMPFVAGVVAAATGVVGILLLTAGSLTACALGMQVSQKRS